MSTNKRPAAVALPLRPTGRAAPVPVVPATIAEEESDGDSDGYGEYDNLAAAVPDRYAKLASAAYGTAPVQNSDGNYDTSTRSESTGAEVLTLVVLTGVAYTSVPGKKNTNQTYGKYKAMCMVLGPMDDREIAKVRVLGEDGEVYEMPYKTGEKGGQSFLPLNVRPGDQFQMQWFTSGGRTYVHATPRSVPGMPPGMKVPAAPPVTRGQVERAAISHMTKNEYKTKTGEAASSDLVEGAVTTFMAPCFTFMDPVKMNSVFFALSKSSMHHPLRALVVRSDYVFGNSRSAKDLMRDSVQLHEAVVAEGKRRPYIDRKIYLDDNTALLLEKPFLIPLNGTPQDSAYLAEQNGVLDFCSFIKASVSTDNPIKKHIKGDGTAFTDADNNPIPDEVQLRMASHVVRNTLDPTTGIWEHQNMRVLFTITQDELSTAFGVQNQHDCLYALPLLFEHMQGVISVKVTDSTLKITRTDEYDAEFNTYTDNKAFLGAPAAQPAADGTVAKDKGTPKDCFFADVEATLLKAGTVLTADQAGKLWKTLNDHNPREFDRNNQGISSVLPLGRDGQPIDFASNRLNRKTYPVAGGKRFFNAKECQHGIRDTILDGLHVAVMVHNFPIDSTKPWFDETLAAFVAVHPPSALYKNLTVFDAGEVKHNPAWLIYFFEIEPLITRGFLMRDPTTQALSVPRCPKVRLGIDAETGEEKFREGNLFDRLYRGGYAADLKRDRENQIAAAGGMLPYEDMTPEQRQAARALVPPEQLHRKRVNVEQILKSRANPRPLCQLPPVVVPVPAPALTLLNKPVVTESLEPRKVGTKRPAAAVVAAAASSTSAPKRTVGEEGVAAAAIAPLAATVAAADNSEGGADEEEDEDEEEDAIAHVDASHALVGRGLAMGNATAGATFADDNVGVDM